MDNINITEFIGDFFDEELDEYIYKILYKLQKESKKYSDLINNEEKIKQTNETLRQVLECSNPQKLNVEECNKIIEFIENNRLKMFEECRASYIQGLLDGLAKRKLI